MSAGRLTTNQSRLSRDNRQLPKRGNLGQAVIRKLRISAIILLALATPVGLLGMVGMDSAGAPDAIAAIKQFSKALLCSTCAPGEDFKVKGSVR